MIAPHEMTFKFHCKEKQDTVKENQGTRVSLCQLTDIVFVLSVGAVHHLQQLHLDLRLVQEWLFILDDLDSNVALLLVVERSRDLPK
jgi:hypothetical protein